MRVRKGLAAIVLLLLFGCAGDDSTVESGDTGSVTDDPTAEDPAAADPSADSSKGDAVSSLQAWVEANDAGGDWADAVAAWAFVPPRMFLDGDFDNDSALQACEAVLTWIADGGEAAATTIRAEAGTLRIDGADGICTPA